MLSMVVLTACGGYPDVSLLLESPLPEKTENLPQEYYEKFIEDIERSRANIASDTDTYTSYLDLGTAYKNFGKLEEAFVAYNKAIEIGPQGIAAWLNRSSVLEDMGKYEDALESYKKTLEIADLKQAYFRIGVILRQHLKAPDSEIRAHYDESVLKSNYDTMIVEDYLYYLVDSEDFTKADEVLGAALASQPGNPRFLEIKESYDNL